MTADDRLIRRDVRRRFDRAADAFDSADFVHRVARDGLYTRLEPVAIEARTVVDLGAATGTALQSLAQRFRKARVVAVDVSGQMVQKCRARKTWRSRIDAVQADARALPFAEHSVDVVFSNLLLPWIDDPAAVANEVARVLRREGLFIFSTLGPDSLLELRRSWAQVDADHHVNRFLDMHDVGDALVRAGLSDPVLDVDRLAVTYRDAGSLFRDLSTTGARNCLAGRRRGLTGKARFGAFRQALEAGAGTTLNLDLELVYGHCWGGGQAQRSGDVRVAANSIPVRQRRS